ncbi:MAG: hypothetical protein GY867_01995, partial [bacterium]|nr:hypothetical protein [bacterium]
YRHTQALDKFLKSSDEFLRETASADSKRDYIEEEFLLSSHWHQFFPYNTKVPDASADCSRDNCAVGCVATAAAQIMRYWSWPPGWEWNLMPDFLDSSSTDSSIDVTAALCRNIGYDVGMNYCNGDCRSSAPTADMETVYEEWRYADCEVVFRDETSQDTWWEMAKQHVSANQPLQYRIVGHSIVLDGWREWYHGYYQPEYHMNYGWNSGDDTWYEIDGLLQVDDEGTWEDEYMIRNIVPAPSLHSSVSGPVYNLSGNRYVNRDCTAHAADFYPGQFVQFLPGVTLVCTELWMKFTGLPDNNTYLYTPVPDRGIRIQNGAMVFYPGAGIRFQQTRPGP